MTETEKYADSEHNVCPTCMGMNLLEEIKIARCAKCSKIYCTHFASAIDPAYCVECLSDVSMIKEIVVKEYTHYNEEEDTITTYRRKARSIKLEGMNWLFAQRKIAALSDDELELSVEYHRGLLNGLLGEREARRIAKAHRFAGVGLPPQGSPVVTTSKKTKSIKSSKQAATASALLESALAGGMDLNQILNLLQGVTK